MRVEEGLVAGLVALAGGDDLNFDLPFVHRFDQQVFKLVDICDVGLDYPDVMLGVLDHVHDGVADLRLLRRLLFQETGVHVLALSFLVRVELIKFFELRLDYICIKLVPMPLDIAQEYISDEVPSVRRGVTLYVCVQVTEFTDAIPHTCVLVSNVERADELTVVDDLYLVVVAVEELIDLPSEEVEREVRCGVVAHTDSACFLESSDLLFICIEV